jgi:hypothetical protein
MTKTKIVDLDELYRFVVDDFFIWVYLVPKNYIRSSQISKFKFRIVQMKFDGEMAKTKVVDLDEFYNFVVDDFSIWNRLLSQNCLLCQNRYISHIVTWLSERYFYLWRMFSLTLLKLLEIFMECLWTQNMLLCQFQEFSNQI